MSEQKQKSEQENEQSGEALQVDSSIHAEASRPYAEPSAEPSAGQSAEPRAEHKKINYEKLREIQRKMAPEIILKDKIKAGKINYIAGFNVSYENNNAVCAAVVLDFKTMQVVDKVYITTKETMPYVPSFLAFRDGPPIIQAFEKLKIKPDVIVVEGHGILHPLKAGLACYVGIALKTPSIGVAKKLLTGHLKGNKVYVGDIARGEIIKTKEHANPLFVSAGSNITTISALDIVQRCIKPPHKLPEPLHIARKLAKDKVKETRDAQSVK